MTTTTYTANHQVVTEYSMMFWAYYDGGFSFPCTPTGEIEEPQFPEGRANLAKLLNGEISYTRKELQTSIRRFSLCSCGSGKTDHSVYDARGIFVASACPKCEDKVKSTYRAEIFTNSDYDCDELVDADY